MVSSEITPLLSVAVVTSQVMIASGSVTRDAVMAAKAEHFFHVMEQAMGNTAEPMMMPMTRYTQPRDRPSLSRMTASAPERMPYTMTMMRDTSTTC